MRLLAATLKNPESSGVCFSGGGEGTEVERLLSGGPDGVDTVLTKCLVRVRILSFSAGSVSVAGSTCWSSYVT